MVFYESEVFGIRLVTFQDVQKRIASAIRWEMVDADTALRYRRGFIYASEVATACKNAVSQHYYNLSKKVNRGIAEFGPY